MVTEIPPELKKEFRELLGKLLDKLTEVEKENKELAKEIFKAIKFNLTLYENHLFADEKRAKEEEERKKRLERRVEDGIFVDTNNIIKQIISVAFQGISRLQGKEWWKKVTNIDFSKDTGYAFEGEFLPVHMGMKKVGIKEGDIIVVYRDMGSLRHHAPYVAVIRVTRVDIDNDKFEYEIIAKAVGKDWAAQILANREAVEKLKQALASKN